MLPRAHAASYGDTNFLEVFRGCGASVGAVGFQRLMKSDAQGFKKRLA
jgi:hypothetical protein